MPKWLRIFFAVTFLACVASATGAFLAAEYGHPDLPRQQSAAPSNGDACDQGDNTPHPAVVGKGQQTSQTGEASPDCIEQRAREHADNEKGLTDYTRDLAHFTLLLAVIAVFQAGFFVWQLVLMNRGVKDARDAADGAMAGAANTKSVADAASLNARAAIALALPILRATPSNPIMLSAKPKAGQTRFDGMINQGRMSKYSYIKEMQVRNVGRTAATPTRINIGWSVCERLNDVPVYTVSHPAHHNAIIVADGEVHTSLDLVVEIDDASLAALYDGISEFWLYVSVEYLDFMDGEREVRFCWKRERVPVGHLMARWISPPDIQKPYTQKK